MVVANDYEVFGRGFVGNRRTLTLGLKPTLEAAKQSLGEGPGGGGGGGGGGDGGGGGGGGGGVEGELKEKER